MARNDSVGAESITVTASAGSGLDTSPPHAIWPASIEAVMIAAIINPTDRDWSSREGLAEACMASPCMVVLLVFG